MEELTHDIPHSIDAEKSVLGSMLISKDAAELATECISADDFYLPKHQQMFSVMAAIGMRGGVIDVVTVIDELERNGFLESIGGIDYITEISMFTQTEPMIFPFSSGINVVKDLKKLSLGPLEKVWRLSFIGSISFPNRVIIPPLGEPPILRPLT